MALERKGLLLKADPIAATFREEVRIGLENSARRPKLVGILSTTSSPSNSYAEFTRKQCEDLGVEFILKKTGAAMSPDLSEGGGVENAIIEANEDASVNGIMVTVSYNLYRVPNGCCSRFISQSSDLNRLPVFTCL